MNLYFLVQIIEQHNDVKEKEGIVIEKACINTNQKDLQMMNKKI
jgi:hypothetical protein